MKIEVYPNKYYLCSNALLCPVNSIDDCNNFEQLLEEYNRSALLSKSPKTILSKKITVDGKIGIAQYAVIKCTHRPSIIPDNCVFYEKLRIGPCIYSRLHTAKDKISIIYQKIGVYAFENDIPLKDETISVYLRESATEIEMDAFVPIDVK